MKPIDQKIYYTLRFAAAMCFIGHGAFGIITKQVWCNYFAVFGIGQHMAYQLMPILGTSDILMGLSILFYPVRAVVSWLVIWGTVTASLRPLSGESFGEVIERAGNFGAPLALLIICHETSKGFFAKLNPVKAVSEQTQRRLILCLKLVVLLLFVGHGWLNLIGKKSLIGQYTSLGFSNPLQVAHIVGIFEIAAGLLVFIRPIREMLVVLLIWKMASELFYPHWEIFEWVERGGSYGAILALLFALPKISVGSQQKTSIAS